MTTRNFRVNNGLSVGDIVISASANTITGMTTSAPSSDGDVSNKKYVDDSIAAISTTAIVQNNTNATISDSGSNGTLTVTADGNTEMTITDAGMQLGGSGARVNTILDEDNMSSNSATALATQQSVKAYIDGEVSSLSSTTITAGNTSAVISDSGSDGALTVTCDGNTELVVNDTSATFSGNVVISGNLTTNGTAVTNSSTNTTIEDALIELGSGNSGSNANDLGLILERGSTGNNGFIGWDESEDKFIVGTTTDTGASTGNLTITSGTLVAATFEGNLTGNVTGNTSGSSGSCTGNSATATEATNVTVSANNTANETVYLTFVDGATGTQGIETDTGLSYNPSTNVLSTTASQAQYADVAERFEADAPMEIGSVVEVGGSAEITEATSEMSQDVFGVISHKPAYMMNAGAGSDDSHPFVAMTGRTPVRVTGVVNKGQRLVTSSIKGCARAVAAGESISPFNVIGRALETSTDANIKLVNCAVRTNN